MPQDSEPTTPERQQAAAFSVNGLAHAHGGPVASAQMRVHPEDFFVEEALPFELSGEGEHLYLFVEKRGENTADVARFLAKTADVKPVNVSYAGLKDRHAVTRQWFSITLPGIADPDLSDLPSSVTLLEQQRHSKKLRRGAVRSNRFKLVLRELQGEQALISERLEAIREAGFPNYFGEQRFGRDYGNLVRAIPVLARGRTRRASEGMYLSSARSMLFNLLLSERITKGCWNNNPMPGDVMQLVGTSSLFVADTIDDEMLARIARQEIDITGPLAGRPNRVLPTHAALTFEERFLSDYAFWTAGLSACRLDADRRALRSRAGSLQWEFSDDKLTLDFSLPKGSYATALTREFLS